MKKIIQELKSKSEYEIHQIGMTPQTYFKGSQEDHDELHKKRAEEYSRAAYILENNALPVLGRPEQNKAYRNKWFAGELERRWPEDAEIFSQLARSTKILPDLMEWFKNRLLEDEQ